MDNEIWKPIPGYEKTYEASSFGRIKRIDKQRILKAESKQPYLQVNLCQNGIKSVVSIHLIIARVFLGECPEGYEVNHMDLNKHNNHLSNLEYVTPLQNKHHAAINHARGDALDNNLVAQIRKEAQLGYTYKVIAQKHNQPLSKIQQLCKKGRISYGTKDNPNRKIQKVTESDIKGILTLKAQGHLSQNQIAKIYELDPGAISMIIRGIYKGRYSKDKT